MALRQLKDFAGQFMAIKKELDHAAYLEKKGELTEEEKAKICGHIIKMFKLIPLQVRLMVFSHKEITKPFAKLGLDTSKILTEDIEIKKV